MGAFNANEVLTYDNVTPSIMAFVGIELIGYCAYKLPQISTLPFNETLPPTYNLRLKETSPLIIAVPLTSIVAFA